jgi:ribA/ribD-fused uncharacterized protein
MTTCCPKCHIYKKYPNKDFCCKSCRDTNGLTHGASCLQDFCNQTIPSTPACCSKCHTYKKYTGKDFCCKLCRDTNGNSHDSRCKQDHCNQQSSCCPKCNRFEKFPLKDFCCTSCRDSGGMTHGRSCNRVPCKTLSFTSTPSRSAVHSSLSEMNCNNLTTGAPLYDQTTTVCFYENSQPYYEFTNFYPAPITIGGKQYPTTEHYFQSEKFSTTDTIYADKIRNATSPREAFTLARAHSNIRPDWHTGYKDKAMKTALIAKFQQHPNLRALLVGTGNKNLVEHTKLDDYWGDKGDGSGQNNLGKMLMEIRDGINKGQYGGGVDYYYKYMKYKQKYLDMHHL